MLNPATPAVVLDAGALERLRELDPTGANQLLHRVLGAFRSSTARLVPHLRDACAARDMAGVRYVAHTLKSSSAGIGATMLAQRCGELEAMIRLGTVDALEARVEFICTEIEVVLQALEHQLGEVR